MSSAPGNAASQKAGVCAWAPEASFRPVRRGEAVCVAAKTCLFTGSCPDVLHKVRAIIEERAMGARPAQAGSAPLQCAAPQQRGAHLGFLRQNAAQFAAHFF